MLRVTEVSKIFNAGDAEVQVLHKVSLDVAAGETLAIMGDSGSGKSTLLHALAGLEPVDEGSISVHGKEITALGDTERAEIRRTTLALIFQQFNLIPSLSVADNIAFQARLAGRDDPDWCATLIARLGLTGLEARFPEEISGGQQQRVAVGRAMATRPALLLADEPTGNLDAATGDQVMDGMLDLVAETGTALILVTHSARLAARLGRTLRLDRGALVG